MIGIIIAGHGGFPSGLLNAVEMIAGTQENMAAVSFYPGQGMEELKESMLQAIHRMGVDEVLLLTDLQGGSPFNAAAGLCFSETKIKVKVVVGTNMPVVLQAVFSRNLTTLDELLAEAIKAGKEGITDMEELLAGINR